MLRQRKNRQQTHEGQINVRYCKAWTHQGEVKETIKSINYLFISCQPKPFEEITPGRPVRLKTHKLLKTK